MIRFQVQFARKRGRPLVYIVRSANEQTAVAEAAARAGTDGFIVSTDSASVDRLD